MFILRFARASQPNSSTQHKEGLGKKLLSSESKTLQLWQLAHYNLTL